MKIIYYAGKIFQLIGLLAMPSALWITEFNRDESLAIGVFVGSLIVFVLGTLTAQFSRKW